MKFITEGSNWIISSLTFILFLTKWISLNGDILLQSGLERSFIHLTIVTSRTSYLKTPSFLDTAKNRKLAIASVLLERHDKVFFHNSPRLVVITQATKM